MTINSETEKLENLCKYLVSESTFDYIKKKYISENNLERWNNYLPKYFLHNKRKVESIIGTKLTYEQITSLSPLNKSHKNFYILAYLMSDNEDDRANGINIIINNLQSGDHSMIYIIKTSLTMLSGKETISFDYNPKTSDILLLPHICESASDSILSMCKDDTLLKDPNDTLRNIHIVMNAPRVTDGSISIQHCLTHCKEACSSIAYQQLHLLTNYLLISANFEY